MKKKLIVANWKMNGSLLANEELVKAIKANAANTIISCKAVLAVPFPYLGQLKALLAGTNIDLAAQDVSLHGSGAFTGEVSVDMLKDFDVRYCLVGHSERRAYHQETDEQVAEKTRLLLADGITPIVCVGETLEEREQGITHAIIKHQLARIIHANGHCISEIVVAYEPVWAIGTGKTATPEQVSEVHALIHAQLAAASKCADRIAILYGGSVNAANAKQLFSVQYVDGGLVGGASLKSDEFDAILRAAG